MSEELPGMSFSKWKRLKKCLRQYYENHVRPDSLSIDVTPEDTTRAFIGSVVQHIMEMVINKRLYKEYSLDELYEIIDEDLKLLKPIMFSVDDLDEAVDGWEKFPIEGARILEEVQKCAIQLSEKGYDNIYYGMNSIIKKIRNMYKKPLKYLVEHPDVDRIRSEVALKVESEFFKHKGEVDFIIEYDDCIDIIDGKKSDTSYLDDDQLFHYKILGVNHYNKPVRNLSWLIYDEGKLRNVEHEGKDIDLLNRMKERWDYMKEKSLKWTKPEDWIATHDYAGCMFCIINDNCIANGTLKDEITEI